jgi:hypothetical protein
MNYTFKDTLKRYFGGAFRKTRWELFCEQWFLLTKSHQYRMRRERILFNQARHRCNRLFIKAMLEPSFFSDRMKGQDPWSLGQVVRPLETYGKKIDV